MGSIDSRHKLLSEGFELRNLSVKAFDINPYSAGIHHPHERVLRVTVKGVPLSVDDGEITKMLKSSMFISQVELNTKRLGTQRPGK